MWDEHIGELFIRQEKGGKSALLYRRAGSWPLLMQWRGWLNRISGTFTFQGADQCASVHLAVVVQGHLLDMDNS